MTDDLLHLWLGMFPNLSNHVLGKIVDFYGGAEGLWNAGEDELRAHLTEKQSGMILQSRDEKKIIAYKNRLKERDITYIYPGHKYFPAILADIPDCPNLLYAKGRVEELNSGRVGIAIVGARKASVYGMENAGLFASELSGYDTVIISGLASGIDSRAQQAAVDSPSGFTIAVLGCGINICYPRENFPLFEKIAKQGVILSEYGLDVPPAAWRFPPRNRIISGLSKGVLVVEAMEKSGSLITADQALEQGREIYAIPGRIGDRNSQGCNNLIKQGAVLVTSPLDIVNDLDLCKLPDSGAVGNRMDMISMNETEKKIMECIGENIMNVEDICFYVKMSPAAVLSILFDMEKKKLVRQPIRSYFVRC